MSAAFLASLTPQSTLAELPAWEVHVAAGALGSEVDEVLRRNPDLPGVIVVEGGRVRGAVSRSQFQQTISRPFGRDVVGPRAIRSLLEEVSSCAPAIIDGATPVQEAVRQALARPAAMLYEPILVGRDDSRANVRLVGFTDLLQADSRISYLRNQQMQEILATVQEGFLLVERDHRIAGEYSRSVETILRRRKLGGMSFPDFLAEAAGPELGDLARRYLETLFNPNVIEQLIGDINPLKAVVLPEREGCARQHLRFAFRRSTEGKEIRRILVRVEDRTRETELAAEIEHQERQGAQRVDLVMEMMQADPTALTDYLARYLAEVAQMGRMLSGSGSRSSSEVIDAIFRVLHGLKGEAAVIGLRTFEQRLHQTEDEVELLRSRRGEAHSDLAVLGIPVESLRALGDEARELISRLGAFARNAPSVPFRPQSAEIVPALQRLIADLSNRLGKPSCLVVHGAVADLPQAHRALLRDVLIQLARNALVHGVETEAERRKARKPVPAVIQLAIRRHEQEGQLEVVFQDDGRGLHLPRIRDRGRELFGHRDFDDNEAAQLIFEPGFSTAASATGDAGRGVGLDLVRETVEGAGGVVLVHSESGAFCAFQIVLPLLPAPLPESIA